MDQGQITREEAGRMACEEWTGLAWVAWLARASTQQREGVCLQCCLSEVLRQTDESVNVLRASKELAEECACAEPEVCVNAQWAVFAPLRD
jgi:hypothetical protein